MYKDIEKKKEAQKERAKQYRLRKKGVTAEEPKGVTEGVTHHAQEEGVTVNKTAGEIAREKRVDDIVRTITWERLAPSPEGASPEHFLDLIRKRMLAGPTTPHDPGCTCLLCGIPPVRGEIHV